MKKLLHNYIYFTHVIRIKELHLYFVLEILYIYLLTFILFDLVMYKNVKSK